MTDPILDIQGLTKSFGALTASRDITLDLRPGEIHALIGPNGAGKSTLIAQIAGALRPDAGRILFDGRDVTALDTAARAQLGMARTFQISALPMDYTVLQNALLGALGQRGDVVRFLRPALRDADLRARAEAALETVGLLDARNTRCAELSHGQRRQLEVAIALTLRPRAFLMDEPMAGLGADGTRALTTLLDGLRAEAPILLVEHDMDAVFALADRISVLVYGQIIATGTVDEIRRDPEVRSAYLGDDTDEAAE
ncbi:ABC transporter ATP-binding protein [uncultured Roseovarius sp.]|uniref:ABC transporter ATP-binding protein n=1 Tax=uncultured Roseovarius sp. TaxID=293344 RepID=UPI000C3CBEC3|nr:ABC transporter ATP-binding protein [Roseovarius sp.]MBD12759.1 ABC transporter ATP-binding protein [Roseovarius sp.]|tara:strand:+ start:840 stop:1604 length:765 start_codon:yes stop_codon:yes gene_type:complete